MFTSQGSFSLWTWGKPIESIEMAKEGGRAAQVGQVDE